MKRNYDDPQYKTFRRKVLLRDGYKCQFPGCKKRKYGLQVHHIIPWSSAASLRYDVSNGICLCRQCHERITNFEHIYIKLFYEIIKRNEDNKRHKRNKRL